MERTGGQRSGILKDHCGPPFTIAVAGNKNSLANIGKLIALGVVVLSASNPSASQTGSIKRVIPWPDRVEAAVQQFVEANAQQLANSIRIIAHPEGRRAELAGYEVLASADRAVVHINVAWSGASTRRSHLVRVTWEFTPAGHLGARVSDDSLPKKSAAKRNAELDEHFREKIYPGIQRTASGEGK